MRQPWLLLVLSAMLLTAFSHVYRCFGVSRKCILRFSVHLRLMLLLAVSSQTIRKLKSPKDYDEAVYLYLRGKPTANLSYAWVSCREVMDDNVTDTALAYKKRKRSQDDEFLNASAMTPTWNIITRLNGQPCGSGSEK